MYKVWSKSTETVHAANEQSAARSSALSRREQQLLWISMHKIVNTHVHGFTKMHVNQVLMLTAWHQSDILTHENYCLCSQKLLLYMPCSDLSQQEQSQNFMIAPHTTRFDVVEFLVKLISRRLPAWWVGRRVAILWKCREKGTESFQEDLKNEKQKKEERYSFKKWWANLFPVQSPEVPVVW